MVMSYSSGELEAMWTRYFEEADLRRAIIQLPLDTKTPQALVLRFQDIERVDTKLSDAILAQPEAAFEAGAQAIRALLPKFELGYGDRVSVRITELPDSCKVSVQDLRDEHLGKLLAVEGIVRRATQVIPQLSNGVFECAACRQEIHQRQDPTSPAFIEPSECDPQQNGCGKPASRVRWKLLPERSTFINVQKLEVQENPERLRGGAHPESLTVLLAHDLVGQVVPGTRMTVNGLVKAVQRTAGSKGGVIRSSLFDFLLVGNSLQREDREYNEIHLDQEDLQAIEALRSDPTVFEGIVDSLAPSMYGLREIKEAIALQLFGGVPKVLPDGIRVRGDIHLLLVGDPSTGKSQLLRYVSDIAPRGIYASGKGASAAGLTAAAVKDDFAGGRWTFEAGAMVLADGGHLAIDEFEKMSPFDRDAIHSGLEQQVIAIAKAGVTITLRSRCPVLAAANPKLGRFDENASPSEQIDLSPPLLSRFDAIFALHDKPDRERDPVLAKAVVDQLMRGEGVEAARHSGEVMVPALNPPRFSQDFLRKYIAYAKQHVFPRMTEGANRQIVAFYTDLRRQAIGTNKPIPVTLRQVEALVRFTEASARARLSPDATEADAERAIKVVQYFLDTVATSENGPIDIDLIQVGISSSYRDEISVVRQLLRELQGAQMESELPGVPIDDLVAKASAKGLPAEKVTRVISELERIHEVYRPRAGLVKLTS